MTYKGFKIIQNGLAQYSIMLPNGEYLCDATSIKKAKYLIDNYCPSN